MTTEIKLEKTSKTAGLILAGGQGRRMGGTDKGLLELNGQSFAQRAAALLSELSLPVFINCNRNLSFYHQFSANLIRDEAGLIDHHEPNQEHMNISYQGPLAGMLSSMKAAKKQGYEKLLIIPIDAPLLQASILSRLLKTSENTPKQLVISHDGQRLQPLVCCIKLSLTVSLERYLQQGHRKTQMWMQEQQPEMVHFSWPKQGLNPFTNINEPGSLKSCSTLLAAETEAPPQS